MAPADQRGDLLGGHLAKEPPFPQIGVAALVLTSAFLRHVDVDPAQLAVSYK
jgi:hypothetical protein